MFAGLDTRLQSTARSASLTSANATLALVPGSMSFLSITLTANVTISIGPGGYDGQVLKLRLVQDGSGSRTVAFDGTVGFGTDITSFTATTTANKADYVGLVWSATAAKWHLIAYARGY